MHVADVMTRDVVTLTRDHSIKHAAQMMLEHRVSGMPVVEDGKLVGMLTEGDMLRRVELGLPGAAILAWSKANSPDGTARDYVRAHAWRVGDVMSTSVVTTAEDATLAEAATVLSTRGVKRLPVLRDGRLVGILSRADLLHAVIATPTEYVANGDNAIAISVRTRLRELGDILGGHPTVTVSNGLVHLWGAVRSKGECDAARVAAESTPHIKGVESHLTILPAGGAPD